ncbi:MAG TPA: diguanylate cyclase [Candidatus Binatia bacterium]|nr:diguanylate cyclase [Candidatus Binatia bacterium]
MHDVVDVLERQLRSGFRSLRFAPELESEFRTEQSESVIVQRLLLLLAGAVLVAGMPFFDGLLLSPPADYIPIARMVEFGGILPALLLAFAFTADPRLRRWCDTAGILALMVVVGGWTYLRHVGAEYGYDLPTILIGVVLAGAFSLAGLFFWAVAPVAALGLCLFAGLELWTRGSTDQSWFNIVALFMLALVTALAGYLQEYHTRAAWLRRRQLKELSLRDPLSGLLNYRAFEQAWQELYNRAAREHRALTVAVVDIDFFKAYNDHYGHPRGDECLRRVADVLRSAAQTPADLVARTGGEEFVIAWPDLTEADAAFRLRTVCREVRELAIPHQGMPQHAAGVVTISIGGVSGVPDPALPAIAMLCSADERLYDSKRAGRDRVTFASLAESVPAARAALRAELLAG